MLVRVAKFSNDRRSPLERGTMDAILHYFSLLGSVGDKSVEADNDG